MNSHVIDILYNLTKPFLFQFDPETIHDLTSSLAQKFSNLIPVYKVDPALCQTIFEQKVTNPIGLAPGFDKYGTIFPSLSPLGFGFSELGSFTMLPQQGNPKPRIKRFPNKKALLNKMGFNNPGLEIALTNIETSLNRCSGFHKIGLSLGKSKHTKNEKVLGEYESLVEKINSFVQKKYFLKEHFLYLAINISSPNTPGLRELQIKSGLSELITTLRKKSLLPLFVKFSPDFSSLKEFLQSLETASLAGSHGFILTNTSVNYSLLSEQACVAHSFQGGVSGLPITGISEKYLTEAHNVLRGDKVLIASGGVMNVKDGWRRILQGASLVQVYTGLVYNGPRFVSKLQEYIKKQLDKHEISSLEEVKHNRDYLMKESLKTPLFRSY